jgi:hypothetical protein
MVFMIKNENVSKIGYGSWYSTQSYARDAVGNKGESQDFKKFYTEKNRACFDRVASELKEGDKVRVTYVGGNSIRRYTGTVKDLFFEENSGYGWLNLQQSKLVRGIYTAFIDEIEIIDS